MTVTGDRAMTERSATRLLRRRQPAAAALWLCDPDHTLHGSPLGSPHTARPCAPPTPAWRSFRDVSNAAARRAPGAARRPVSDHGQETIGDFVDVDAWLARQGLAEQVAAGAVATAGQGTAVLLYAMPMRGTLCSVCSSGMRAEPWVGELLVGDELARRGFAPAAAWSPRSAWRAAISPTTTASAVQRCGGRRRQDADDRLGPAWRMGPGRDPPFLLLNEPGSRPGGSSSRRAWSTSRRRCSTTSACPSPAWTAARC
jgi:hypothetical protein